MIEAELRDAEFAASSWTGPLESDLEPDGETLREPVPPERWPHGPPSFHEACCILHKRGRFCDCKASDASDEEWGEGQYTL